MTTSSPIKVAHLSDIHFYESSDGQIARFCHSVDCLKRIESLLEDETIECLIVTGDITNMGDKLSLQRVYQWIDDKIYIDGDYYGLRAREKGIKTIVVPGNHDAFNAPTHGSYLHRWQTSLTNYYSEFHDHSFSDTSTCVGYRWLQKGQTKVFICYVDSCYLGDPETEQLPGFLSISKIAKGKFSRKQSEAIMRLYDDGLAGLLLDDSKEPVTASDFLCSLKVLVMHHYIFEPSDAKAEPLLHLDDRKTVFQNIAMSDFDIMLCGHKHISDVCLLAYSDHFDARGRARLAFNHVRRAVGISSLPLQHDINGRLFARMYRFILNMFYRKYAAGTIMSDADVEEIIAILKNALENPSLLKSEFWGFLRNRRSSCQPGLFDEMEIEKLHREIMKKFDNGERKRLMRTANSLRGLVTKLAGRPFAHVMSGSSAKASETNTRHRAVNIYEFQDDPPGEAYIFSAKRYSLTDSPTSKYGNQREFAEPITQTIEFPYARLEELF